MERHIPLGSIMPAIELRELIAGHNHGSRPTASIESHKPFAPIVPRAERPSRRAVK